MERIELRLCALAVLAVALCGPAFAGRGGGKPRLKPEDEAAEEEKEKPKEKVKAPPRKPRREEAPPRGAAKRKQWLLAETTAADRMKASEAQALYEQGLAAYEDLRYKEAKKLFEQALVVYPAHENARKALSDTKALLGYRRDVVMKAMRDLTSVKKVKMQQALVEIQNVLERARRYYDGAHLAQVGDEERESDAILARQIKDLEEAISRYGRALEIIRWLPYNINLTQYRGMALDMRNKATSERAQKLDDLKSWQTRVAMHKAEARKREERRYYQDRIEKLFEQANRYFEYKQYDSCENMCKQILKIDPRNDRAESLIYRARRAEHELIDAKTHRETKHHRRAVKVAVAEASIPYSRRLVYPSHWDKIVERVETATAVGVHKEGAWQKEIERALDKKVSFEFVETPLSEAISFLQTLTKVNMILDPKATEGRETPINLKVSNMSLKLALDWILKLADLDCALRDDAIFISIPEELKEDVLLRMYDVRDLTMIIQNFPGPDFNIMLSGQQDMSTAIVLDTGAEEERVTADSLAEMIQNRVKPDSWAAELGTSIEQRGGKLVVMQRPEVHKLIGRLLESFRATQKLLITVEARFLEISERFWEEIGWQWGGLSGQPRTGAPGTSEAMTGPGGLTNPLGPTGLITSQTLLDRNLHDFSDNIMPIPPPLTTLPSSQTVDTGVIFNEWDITGNSQMLNIVGAIHTGGIGDSISGRPRSSPEDTQLGGLMTPPYNTVEQTLLRQGLNAQITYLGQMEAMAFLHALKVREQGTVLTAPRLTVYNTQRAHMFAATQRSYVADYEVSGDMYDPVIRQFLQGAVLDVKPIVSSDRRYITVEVRPTTAELVIMQDLVITAYIIVQVGAVARLYAEELPIQFPVLELRKVRTTVTIPDGGIIMLGGMMKDTNFKGTTAVPFISHLPIIGKLFRWDLTDKEQTSLSILLTARLLIFEEEERKL